MARAPVLTVYSVIDIRGEGQATYASLKEREVYLFNTSYYGDLRACALEALARILAVEGVRFLHGGATQVNGRTLLLLYPVEVIHPTPGPARKRS